MKCVVGRWHEALDAEDRAELKRAVERKSRADLYADICTAHGTRPFGLTALKQHLNRRCFCD